MLSMTCRDPGRAPLQFWRQRRTAGPPRRTGEAVRTADDRTEELDAPPETARVRVMDRAAGPAARPRSLPAAAAPRGRRLRRRVARARRAPRPRRRRQADRDARRRGAARGPSARRRPPRGLQHPGIVALYESGRDERRRVPRLGARAGPHARRADGGGRAVGPRRRARRASRCATRWPTRTAAASSTATSSPANIMVPDRPHDGAGVAKLTDFGVARIAGEDVAHAHRRRRRHARVHGARAGRGPRRRRRGRPLRARARPLRGARRGQPGARARRGVHGAARRRAPSGARAPAPRPPARPLRRDRPGRPAAPRAAGHDRGPAPRARARAARAWGTTPATIAGSPLEGIAEAAVPRARTRPLARVLAAVAAGALTTAAVAWLGPAPPLPPRPPERPPRRSSPCSRAWAGSRSPRRSRPGWRPPSARARPSSSSRRPADRRSSCAAAGPLWSAPAIAPVLGLAGLRGAWPALAGQAARPWHRLALGALGAWWLVLAEAVAGERLATGPPRDMGAGSGPRSMRWTTSSCRSSRAARCSSRALWALAAARAALPGPRPRLRAGPRRRDDLGRRARLRRRRPWRPGCAVSSPARSPPEVSPWPRERSPRPPGEARSRSAS